MAGSGVRILVYPQAGGVWTALAVEHDISAEARTLESAVDALLSIVRAHTAYDRRHNREPMSAFAPAPRRFRDAFARGTRLPHPVGLDGLSDDSASHVIVAMVPEYPAHERRLPVLRSA